MTSFLKTICCTLLVLPASGATYTLANERIKAEFGDRGLAAIEDFALKTTFHFTQDDFSLMVSDLSVSTQNRPPGEVLLEKNRLTYHFSVASYGLNVTYELRPGWRFVTKHLVLTAAPGASFRVKDLVVANIALTESAMETYVPKSRRPDLETKDYGAFLRFSGRRGIVRTGPESVRKVRG
jgi:hypothetical protein